MIFLRSHQFYQIDFIQTTGIASSLSRFARPELVVRQTPHPACHELVEKSLVEGSKEGSKFHPPGITLIRRHVDTLIHEPFFPYSHTPLPPYLSPSLAAAPSPPRHGVPPRENGSPLIYVASNASASSMASAAKCARSRASSKVGAPVGNSPDSAGYRESIYSLLSRLRVSSSQSMG